MDRDEQLAAFEKYKHQAYQAAIDYMLTKYDVVVYAARKRLDAGVREFPDAPMFDASFDHFGNLLEELADAVNYMVGRIASSERNVIERSG